MPELPEMETYKNLLTKKIAGKTITDIIVNREKSINIPVVDFVHKVKDQEITAVERRGKYLLFHLKNGAALLLHLMLGGLMFFGTEAEKPDRTVQIQLAFGTYHLYFIGLRLGYLHLLSAHEVKEQLADLGPEPLGTELTRTMFLDKSENKRGRLKTVLTNQGFIAGIGNRYADEIAWHAQLLPERNMNEMAEQEKSRLYDSIRFVLRQAIQYGGYMEQPLYTGDEHTGKYGSRMYVYNREGEACRRCGTPITRKKMSARKVFFCSGCQF
jgi:formamidopyrimidine-DNA glycosylase